MPFHSNRQTNTHANNYNALHYLPQRLVLPTASPFLTCISRMIVVVSLYVAADLLSLSIASTTCTVLLVDVGCVEELRIEHKSGRKGMEWNGMEWNGMEWNGRAE